MLAYADDPRVISRRHDDRSLVVVLFNDNGIFEYILQDEIFLGVIGMLECECTDGGMH